MRCCQNIPTQKESMVEIPEYALVCLVERLNDKVSFGLILRSECMNILGEILDPIESEQPDLCDRLYSLVA